MNTKVNNCIKEKVNLNNSIINSFTETPTTKI